MKSDYDVIILGSGHNALVLQAYLARADLSTLCIEKNDVPGGGLATIEHPGLPGFLHNTHSFFHRGITGMPWFSDLELGSNGAEYLEPELNVAMHLRDGRSLQWWSDHEKTIDSFRQFSEQDAERIRHWIDIFEPIVDKILSVESRNPPLAPQQRVKMLESSAEGRILLDVSKLSPLEFVMEEFENDVVRAGLLFFNGLREIDLRLKGFGHAIPALLAARQRAQMCRGGSVQLAHSLGQVIKLAGGDILCGTALKQINHNHGAVSGVETVSGERFHAPIVVSGLNPLQTFVELMDGVFVPDKIQKQARDFRYNKLAPLFGIYLALKEAPRYRATENDPALSESLMTIIGLDHVDQFSELVQAHEAGVAPPRIMWGATPSVLDPTQAPTDCHTAFMWQKVPYSIQGDAQNWEHLKEYHSEQLLDQWRDFAPNVDANSILGCLIRTPRDTVADLPNMRFGDLLVGSFEAGQIGYNRPFTGAGNYRTAVKGLYLCGGCTHPGGNVTGLCGYNAARVVATDLGITLWWNPQE